MKNFAIFKVTEKKNDKAPDYSISMKVGEQYVNIGAGWIKEGKNGKFISCKMSDSFTGPKGVFKGYSITEDKIENTVNTNDVDF